MTSLPRYNKTGYLSLEVGKMKNVKLLLQYYRNLYNTQKLGQHESCESFYMTKIRFSIYYMNYVYLDIWKCKNIIALKDIA